METRALLAIVLSILILLGFQYFMGPSPPENPSAPPADSVLTQGTDRSPAPAQPEQTVKPPEAEKAPLRETRDITVTTDLLRVTFTEKGGTIRSCLLKAFPVKLGNESELTELVALPSGGPPFFDLDIPGIGNISSHLCTSDREDMDLTLGSAPGTLAFTCHLPDGRIVTREYTFHPGSYLVESRTRIRPSGQDGGGVLSIANRPLGKNSSYVFEGPEYSSNGSLVECKLEKPGESISFTGPIDWTGYGNQYFLTTIIPASPSSPSTITFSKKNAEGPILSTLQAGGLISGNGETVIETGLYLGPKDITYLEAAGHNLTNSINFGWFDPIAKPLLYALRFLDTYLHNYGVAIIIITIVIKILFWPLAYKSAKSMKTLQKIQPKLAKLKEKYGDDRERLNKELMQLYKTYKVNPLGGCLPMLLQIPVFFALYKVLLQSIELRHAPFMLWINDLSAPDRLMIPGIEIPYLVGIPVLTILMGISMYFQQKMAPTSLDPTQAKIMQFLPVVFTFMFITFPSGLVLYWLVNNVLSIAQQYYINKFTD